jgi:Xaa-Pro aminopeptidase
MTSDAERRETPAIGWAIGAAEYEARLARVRAELQARRLDGLVLFHPIRMAYVSGFFHLSTERPMAIVVPIEGDGLGALIPLLEREHIAKAHGVAHHAVYPEYPTGGGKHPMYHLADLLAQMGLDRAGRRLGFDNDGYLDVNGYDGPALSEIAAGVETVRARDLIDRLRAVKSPAELDLIVQSCVWGNLAHRLMVEKLALGRNEIEIALDASTEASRMMVAALGPGYQQLGSTYASAPATVVFSAGANTALPHGLGSGAGIQRGDVLVTYAGADVGGYTSELERTMLVGEPTPEFEKHFALMLRLQQTAFDALRPGRTFADAESDVADAFRELGLGDLQRHHTGHGIGLEGHEWPFIDLGSADVPIEENMVLSVEPGLYVPGLAGFRHSDTVVIRAGGAERLTFYPRDLESLTVSL